MDRMECAVISCCFSKNRERGGKREREREGVPLFLLGWMPNVSLLGPFTVGGRGNGDPFLVFFFFKTFLRVRNIIIIPTPRHFLCLLFQSILNNYHTALSVIVSF